MVLDNKNLNDDDSHKASSDTWKELINSENKEDTLSFLQLMELVKKHNIGFEFTMLQDNYGMHTGCMW